MYGLRKLWVKSLPMSPSLIHNFYNFLPMGFYTSLNWETVCRITAPFVLFLTFSHVTVIECNVLSCSIIIHELTIDAIKT